MKNNWIISSICSKMKNVGIATKNIHLGGKNGK